MNEIATLLHTFGFSTRDAKKIAQRALDNGLALADVQAWTKEAQHSTSLYNPLGFVRARIQDGDKMPAQPAADRRHPDSAERRRMYVVDGVIS